MSKQDYNKTNQMAIVILSNQSVSFLKEVHKLMVVQISQSVFGMQIQDQKLTPSIKTTMKFLHNLKHHQFKIILYQNLTVFQFCKYLKHHYFKLKETQS
ncbi:unnamed protein product [Paramecium primaurelia]|uniref:Uncharacterized protein n=1 Tax=Paramecium primaurelia TaxID=5886 RepID=A0A8S1KBV1_PARPR|nr:unnamed protein product [Paramecium primaurelia]